MRFQTSIRGAGRDVIDTERSRLVIYVGSPGSYSGAERVAKALNLAMAPSPPEELERALEGLTRAELLFVVKYALGQARQPVEVWQDDGPDLDAALGRVLNRLRDAGKA